MRGAMPFRRSCGEAGKMMVSLQTIRISFDTIVEVIDTSLKVAF